LRRVRAAGIGGLRCKLVEQDIQILPQKLMPERRILPRAGNVVLG
jgi:hypothetical protein